MYFALYDPISFFGARGGEGDPFITKGVFIILTSLGTSF